jgi:hypothetical protein
MDTQEKDRLTVIFSDDNAETLAEELVCSFEDNENDEKIEIDGGFKGGSFDSEDINTKFSVNAVPDSFFGVLVNEFSDDNIDKEAYDLLESFEEKVGEKLLLNGRRERLAYKLRKFTPIDKGQAENVPPKVLDDFLKTLFPLSNISLKRFQLNPSFQEGDTGGYVLKVFKNQPEGYVFSKGIAQDLIERKIDNEEKTFDELIKESQDAGDQDYKYVSGYEKKYYESQCQIGLFVDFSLGNKEAVDKKAREINNRYMVE